MLNSDIRDQAYQFFVEEAPELLEAIENGLLSLRENRSTAQVHEVMRAAHSIKGGAASVELDVIKTIAHRLETIFKALYDETVVIDTFLESQLLQAYDCLRLPLMEQIELGNLDEQQALQAADAVFSPLEEQLGEALQQADNYLPTSTDLGVDMVASIFEIDVAQGLERLMLVAQHPTTYPIAGELQAQAEVFIGLAELLDLPGFGTIAQQALTALELHPEQALTILQLALVDFEAGRNAVLQGDRIHGGAPSAELTALAQSVADGCPQMSFEAALAEDVFELDASDPGLSELLSETELLDWSPVEVSAEPEQADWAQADWTATEEDPLGQDGQEILPDLETLWGNALIAESVTSNGQRESEVPVLEDVPSLEDVFESDLSESDLLAWNEVENTDQLDGLTTLPPSLDGLELPSLDAAPSEMIQNGHSLADMPTLPELTLSDFSLPEFTVAPSQEIADRLPLASALDEQQVFDEQQLNESAIWLESPPEQLEKLETAGSEQVETGDDLIQIPEEIVHSPLSIEQTIETVEHLFEELPSLADEAQSQPLTSSKLATELSESQPWKQYLRSAESAAQVKPTNLSVRVDLDRLERMNNLVSELAISRNSLSLQNEQMQSSVRNLAERFDQFQFLIGRLQDLSDQMLVAPVSRAGQRSGLAIETGSAATNASTLLASFDTLEMDRYSILHFQLQDIFEQVMQLEEALGDIGLFAGQSNQTLGQQRQKLAQLQNELMWARMLPLGNVLNRFPRVLRDLSAKYSKPVSLKLTGTGVLVDKVVLEKLYDPLLHLLRNAFDHGIELPNVRLAQEKSAQGTIEIRAYHRGNQTLIEIADDGKGLDIERIGQRAVELGWLSREELQQTKPAQLLDFIFEPGFSTAVQVSELSGRGVGLDVVRAQLRSLKGNVSVSSTPDKGTTFTLRIPLTLTMAKLLTCLVGTTPIAVPSDSIEEILVPQASQIKQTGSQQFLYWREHLVPIYRMSRLLNYACLIPESSTSEALTAVTTPKEWALPLLVIQREQHSFALEVDRLITEQELVIKPFGSAIAPPTYTYGCTILGDGSLVPVIDAATLVDLMLEPSPSGAAAKYTAVSMSHPPTERPVVGRQAQTILVVDDSSTLRRMLALTLEKSGYRVVQARDGQEALSHLQPGTSVQLVICDIEMPNMNGFEFLSQRRQQPHLTNIPVVMLTSRSNDKHRRLAMHLGATSYFSKPYIEQGLLSALKELLQSQTAASGAEAPVKS